MSMAAHKPILIPFTVYANTLKMEKANHKHGHDGADDDDDDHHDKNKYTKKEKVSFCLL